MASRLLLLLALLAACGRTTMQASVVDAHGERDEFAEMDFWDGLAETRAVTNHDALHALMLSFELPGADNFAARLAAAKERRWIAKDLAANETARVGWIAKAVCLEAGIQGGLTMRLLGARERYALKELNHRGWLPNMSTNQAISGLQLITLLTKVEDAQAGGPDLPREEDLK